MQSDCGLEDSDTLSSRAMPNPRVKQTRNRSNASLVKAHLSPGVPSQSEGPAKSPNEKVVKERLKGLIALLSGPGGDVRIASNILGVLMVLIGTIWFLQGINVLPG